jgi:O-antigen/teichoic acid export membrane protein
VALLALGRPIFPTAVNFIGMLLKVGMIFYFVPRLNATAFAVILAGYFIFTVGVSSFRVILDVYRRLSQVSPLETSV